MGVLEKLKLYNLLIWSMVAKLTLLACTTTPTGE